MGTGMNGNDGNVYILSILLVRSNFAYILFKTKNHSICNKIIIGIAEQQKARKR